MKKILTVISVVIVTFAFLLFALASGSDSSDSKEITNGGETSTDKVEEKVTIEEQVVFEHDGIVATAKEYVNDSIWGDGIKLLIENNSDKDVSLTCDNVIVNDYMITDLFVETVAAGKKANATLYLSSNQLKAAGISNVGKVEIYFRTYDSETYDTIYKADAVVLKTSVFDIADSVADNVGAELYNQNGLRIVGKYVDENSFWGASVLFYIENNTSQNVTVSVDDLSVNGFMMESLFYSNIFAGKKSVDEITIFNLEENGIETIENIEFKFRAYNSDTYTDIVESEVIVINNAE